MQKAVFLDKDGTLIDDIPYNVNPALITWKAGCFEALRKLEQAGYLLIIATNQSGMARGYFDEKDMDALISSMTQTLKEQDIRLGGFYYSPYLKEGKIKKYAIESDYRKPGAGMLLKASVDLNIDLSSSWMVGDVWKDVVAGNRAGCRTVLIHEPGAPEETTDDIPAYLLEEQPGLPGNMGHPLNVGTTPLPGAGQTTSAQADALRTPTFTVSCILKAADRILRTDTRLPNG